MDSLQTFIAENLTEVVAALIAGVIIAVLSFCKDWLREFVYYRIRDVLFKKKHDSCPSSSQIECERQTRDMLTELRYKLKADRCHVWQFHNGSVFSSQNPLFRVTCTHESCGAGVSHEMQSTQGLMATMMLEVISPMFGVDVDAAFAKSVPNEMKLPLFWLDVSKMPCSYCKSLLTFQGTKSVCISPLIYQDQRSGGEMRNKIMGFVAANFNDQMIETSLPDNLGEVARYASEIAYAVNSFNGHYTPTDSRS